MAALELDVIMTEDSIGSGDTVEKTVENGSIKSNQSDTNTVDNTAKPMEASAKEDTCSELFPDSDDDDKYIGEWQVAQKKKIY